MKTVRSKPAAVAVAAPAKPSLWPYGAGLLAALVAAFLAYGPALNGPFLFDDRYLPMFQGGAESLPLSTWLRVRPFLMLTYWVNFQSSGINDTFGYHLVNLLLHAMVALLIGWIVRELLRRAGTMGPLANLLGAFGGGLFLLHPVQTEAVAYITSRSENLSVWFYYAAFTVFLSLGKKAIGWGRAIGVLVLFSFAVLTKEHTITLPALLLLTDYYWNPGFSLAGVKRNWRLYALTLVGAVLGGVVGLLALRITTSAGFAIKEFTWYQYLFTQFRAVWSYVGLFVFPVGLSADPEFPISRSLTDHGAIIGLVALITAVGAAWWYRRRYPLASYGFFVFLLLLLPTSSVLPIQDPFAERRLYLPFLGLVLVLVDLLRHLPVSRQTLTVGLGVILLGAAGLTYARSQVWGDTLAFWEDATRRSPGKARAHFQLAHAYYQAQRCSDAAKEYEAAARLERPDQRLLIDWALAYDCVNQPGPAVEKLEQAAALPVGPSGEEHRLLAHIYGTLGMIYGKQNKLSESRAAIEKGLVIDPSYDLLHVYRGNLYAAEGNAAEATAEFQRAIAINPANQMAKDALVRLAVPR